MFEQIKDWWESISEREQKLTLISGVVVIIAGIYFLAWQPLANNLEKSQQSLRNAEQSLQWVEVNSNKILSAGLTADFPKAKQTLSQLISSTAKRNQIDIARIQRRNGTVDIWINQIEFNQFIGWITNLQNQQQVNILNVDINKDKVQGMVKVNRLSLSY